MREKKERMRSFLFTIATLFMLGGTACYADTLPVPSTPEHTSPANTSDSSQTSSACLTATTDTVKAGSFSMPYLKFGKPGKQPIVILPGLSVKSVIDQANAIADAYKIFADDYEVYLIDRRSSIPAAYSLYDMAKDTEEALDALHLSQCYLVGFSQGGMIAQIIATERPDLVHKMVLGSTTAQVTPRENELFNKWTNMAQENNLSGLAHDLATNIYSEGFCQRYADAYSAYIQSASQEDLRRFIIFAHSMENFNISEQLHKISCPVLVLGSYHDKVIAPEASAKLAQMLHCQIYMYDGYSHAVYDEAPDYKERVLNFFNGR